jgi:hypothetical protein
MLWSVVLIVAIVVVAGHDVDCESYKDDCQQCVVEGCTFCRGLIPTDPYRCRSGGCNTIESTQVCRPDPNFDKTKACDQVSCSFVGWYIVKRQRPP